MDKPDSETQVLHNQVALTWDQVKGFVDPVMVLNDEQDRVVRAVKNRAEQEGLTIESMSVTVEIRVEAIAR